MIAYNKTWLDNIRLREMLKNDLAAGRINDDEFKNISQKYPVGFYSPGIFARVGLFILTCVVVSFAYGLISLMLASTDVFDSPGFPVFLGILSYIGLELMVNANKHYRSGVDDALLFITACMFTAALTMEFSGFGKYGNYTALYGLAFLLFLGLSVRFTDMLMAAACCACLFAFVFSFWTKAVPSGLSTVPFAMMLAAAGAYGLAYANRAKFVNHQNCLIIAQLVCLLVLCAAGNYYIIQTLSDQLHGTVNSAIPFGGVFWAWTITIPVIYVGFGIRKKDAILLRTGLLLVAAAVITFRTYYHILPLDAALTIGGALLLGVASVVIQYLKTPKYGFTYADTDTENIMDHLKVESLIVAEGFSTHAAAPSDKGVKFGGGDFGGGGSSGDF